jgi:dethiobiotin synthetase
MRGLFITGTDTGVGKTHVACAIVRELRAAGLRVGAFKPACSGARLEPLDTQSPPRWDDLDALRGALGRDVGNDQLCPQRFIAPLAPPVAARAEGRSVDLGAIERGFAGWRDACDCLIVEGAGGLLCPLTDSLSFADLARQFQLPLLIVARRGLGTINHTLLTIEAAQRRNLTIAGIVLNETAPNVDDPSSESNAQEISARCDVPILAIRRFLADGWVSRFGEPIQLDWPALMTSACVRQVAE